MILASLLFRPQHSDISLKLFKWQSTWLFLKSRDLCPPSPTFETHSAQAYCSYRDTMGAGGSNFPMSWSFLSGNFLWRWFSDRFLYLRRFWASPPSSSSATTPTCTRRRSRWVDSSRPSSSSSKRSKNFRTPEKIFRTWQKYFSTTSTEILIQVKTYFKVGAKILRVFRFLQHHFGAKYS